MDRKKTTTPFTGFLIASVFALASQWSVAATVDDYIIWQGDFVQGGIVVGHFDPQVVKSISFNGKALQMAEQGAVVFGFDRDGKSGDVVELRLKSGELFKKTLKIDKREYNIQRIEGISKKIMNPVKRDWTRIKNESAMVGKARKARFDRADYLETFIWPATGPITGVFGSQRVYNGVPKRPHYGIDIAGPVGTPIVAPASGVVTLAHPDMFYSGGTMIIDHGHGLSSTFLHMSKIDVKVGQEVKQGERVGDMGASGRATGSHLDWRMNWKKRRVDARLILPKASREKAAR